MSESADYLAEQCHKDKGTYAQVETRHVRAVLAENERFRSAFWQQWQSDQKYIAELEADNERLREASAELMAISWPAAGEKKSEQECIAELEAFDALMREVMKLSNDG